MHGLCDWNEESSVNGRLEHSFHVVRATMGWLRRGTLSPMGPLITEFQLPIAHILENMHVIEDSQV